jgi:hypothetical protein
MCLLPSTKKKHPAKKKKQKFSKKNAKAVDFRLAGRVFSV